MLTRFFIHEVRRVTASFPIPMSGAAEYISGAWCDVTADLYERMVIAMDSFVRDIGMTPDEFCLLMDKALLIDVRPAVPADWDDEAFDKALGASKEVFADV